MVPSLGQIGQYPSITADTIISGHDEFTGSNITYSRKAVSSQLTSDPLVQGSSADSVK